VVVSVLLGLFEVRDGDVEAEAICVPDEGNRTTPGRTMTTTRISVLGPR
jgi:hypothetical protein